MTTITLIRDGESPRTFVWPNDSEVCIRGEGGSMRLVVRDEVWVCVSLAETAVDIQIE